MNDYNRVKDKSIVGVYEKTVEKVTFTYLVLIPREELIRIVMLEHSTSYGTSHCKED